MAVSRVWILASAAALALSCGSPAAESVDEPDVPCAEPSCSDDSAEAEVGTSPPDPGSLIRFSDEAGAVERRGKLRTYVWGAAELPAARPELTEDVWWPAGTKAVDRSLVARLDRLEAAVTGTNVRARSYVFRPMMPAEDGTRVVIIHQGHTGPFEDGGLGRAASFLLERGFVVVAMHMPLFGWNAGNPNGWKNHRQMFASASGDEDLGRIFRMFLEPIVQNVTHFEGARDIAMIGLSGGGWAATVAAAIDPRIRVSVEVAGSAPLYAREISGDTGDREQYEPTLFSEDIAPDGSGGGVTTWLEMYVLAGLGAGRQALQVNNEFDPCCFRGGTAATYAGVVSDRVRAIGAGEWANVIDGGATKHEISENVLESVLLPALWPPVKPSGS